MYNHILRASDGYYATGQTVPQNTSAFGDEGSLFTGNAQGAMAISIFAKTDVVLADTKVLTLNIYDSADNSTFALFAKCTSVTADGETTYSAGDQIGDDYVLPPSANEWTKAQLVTDDAAVTGTVDVFLHYLPR